jgi:phosphoribosyl-AMP cyclohydrolase
VLFDCDADTLLVKVDAAGPACHTGERTCFFRVLGRDAVTKL